MLVALMTPVASASAPSSYLTTGFVGYGAAKTTIAGFTGVVINYNNTYSVSFSAFVYLVLVNSAGQTVYWTAAGCSVPGNSPGQCFVPIYGALSGTYTANLFATTNFGVPISVVDTLTVVLS